MASHELKARLKFLSHSSHLLVATAPGISRFLISRCNELVADNNVDQEDLKMPQTCNACGTLVILGWECSLQIESLGSRRYSGKRSNNILNRHRTAVYSCKTCGAETRQALDIIPISRHKVSAMGLKASATSKNQILYQATVSQNIATEKPSSSKKRKRNKNSNLEALLNKSRATKQLSSQLDLMDFMDKV